MKFINILVRLSYSFLVIYVAQYKKFTIWHISFSKLSNVLTILTCIIAIGNLYIFCFRDNILISFSLVDFNGNIPLLKTFRTNCLLS